MKVSKIEWFYVSKETKDQSGRPIRFLNNFIQFSMQYITTFRTSRSQMYFEIVALKVCNIHRKTPVMESPFSKVGSLEAYKFIKQRLQLRGFPVNIANFLRKLYLKHTTGGCFCTWNSPGISLYESGNWWHIFSIKYFVSIMYFFIFFLLSVLLKLIKHFKLIIFENYNECKTKHLFLIKKSSYTVW